MPDWKIRIFMPLFWGDTVQQAYRHFKCFHFDFNNCQEKNIMRKEKKKEDKTWLKCVII